MLSDCLDWNMNIDDWNIGFIGAGNMTMAIVKGLIDYGGIRPCRIHVSAPSNTNLPSFERLGCSITNDNYSLVYNHKCSIIFLCVKPHIMNDETHIFKLVTIPHPLIIISVIAGVTLDSLYAKCFTTTNRTTGSIETNRNYAPDRACIYRIMPNVACQVGKGVAGIARYLPATDTHDQLVESLLKRIFSCHFMPESQLDQLTALSGSGIAFAYSFIQSMADAGVKIGLSRPLAIKISTETITGACQMVNLTKKNPIDLRDAVCSPAGTTIYGIHAMEKAGFSSGVIDSITASYDRCMSLKK